MKNRALIAATVLPSLLFAHPGHGPVEAGPAHYLFSPIHLIGLLALVAIAFAIYYYGIRKNKNA